MWGNILGGLLNQATTSPTPIDPKAYQQDSKEDYIFYAIIASIGIVAIIAIFKVFK